MNIYELHKDFIEIQELIELNDGEITEDIAKRLSLNSSNFKEKAANYARFIANLNGEVLAYKEEIERLTKRKLRNERLIAKLKENLSAFMATADLEKVDLGIFKLAFRQSKAVEIIGDVPDMFARITREPDKVSIKKALESGEALDFARLKTNKTLQVQ